MQPTEQKTVMTTEHIRRVRALRKAAVRRRRILVLSLLGITLIVLVVGFSGLYSPAFALIPFALLAFVIFCGINASKSAREWEARVKRASIAASINASRNLTRNSAFDSSAVNSDDSLKSSSQSNSQSNSIDKSSLNPEEKANEANEVASAEGDSVATSVMEKREIRLALRRSMQDQQRAFERRSKNDDNSLKYSSSASENLGVKPEYAESSVKPAFESSKLVSNPNNVVAEDAVEGMTESTVYESKTVESSSKSNSENSDSSHDSSRNSLHLDSTNEINTVRASRGLDVFDLATASLSVDSSDSSLKSHDLISFSLGSNNSQDSKSESKVDSELVSESESDAKSSSVPESDSSYAPESLEIKSTKQVTKAVPVKFDSAENAKTAKTVNAKPIKTSKLAKSAELEVEPPAKTEDSLGSADLLDVLARRNQA
ncbi:hypothetical protein BFS05_03150 [Gardnerella vaginalis]|uniref:Uncharacterized protein n=3 Tax=Gardnerella TaxID=2701 RepID=A0A2K1SVM1_GARVA|nr:hypothetical protein BFS05_03150 [Gardnerella vaginalis]